MRMWIVCWVAEGNMPGCDIFTEKEQAFSCLNYMMETGRTAIVKTVNIEQKQEEPAEEQGPKVKVVETPEDAAEGPEEAEVR